MVILMLWKIKQQRIMCGTKKSVQLYVVHSTAVQSPTSTLRVCLRVGLVCWHPHMKFEMKKWYNTKVLDRDVT